MYSSRQYFFRTALLCLSVLAAVIFVGCSGSVPRISNPGSKTVKVVTDPGIRDSMTGDQKKMHRDLMAYMEQDLMSRLKRSGFMVQKASEDASAAGANEYVLHLTTKNYNPGSKAARILVGYGAGSCSLDTRVKLSGSQGEIMKKEDGVGSSQDWRRCVVVMNQRTVERVVNAVEGR